MPVFTCGRLLPEAQVSKAAKDYALEAAAEEKKAKERLRVAIDAADAAEAEAAKSTAAAAAAGAQEAAATAAAFSATQAAEEAEMRALQALRASEAATITVRARLRGGLSPGRV